MIGVIVVAAACITGDPRIAVEVDPRVELMSLIFRLAGHPEYNQPNSASPYADEVEKRFGRFRTHDVVIMARALRGRRGVSYDAVMSMAVHVTDATDLGERVDFDTGPPRLDDRWQVDEAREFLAHARNFVQVSSFDEFVAEQGDFYAAAAERLGEVVARHDYVQWFESFFGVHPGATFKAIPGLLNGGANYGVGIRFPDGTEQITPVIGVWDFDVDGVPVFGDGISGTIAHELCHSYTNPIVDRFADRLQAAGIRIYPRVAVAMRRQAYGDWKTMMYESLVRACTVRFARASEGEAAATAEIAHHRQRGFTWIAGLSNLLGEYERDRDRYPDLATFMPRIVEFFDQEADRQARQAVAAPRIVSMIPANGAVDVDPALATIRVVFDRPMTNGSWSVVGGGPSFPDTDGAPFYDLGRRAFTLPVKLKPGHTYRFALNSVKFTGFKSTKGVPLEPVEVTFTTLHTTP